MEDEKQGKPNKSLSAEQKLEIHEYLGLLLKKWGIVLGITNLGFILVAFGYIFFMLPKQAVNEIKYQAVNDIKSQIESQINNAIRDLTSQLQKTLVEYGQAKNQLEGIKNDARQLKKDIEQGMANSKSFANELNSVEELIAQRRSEFSQLAPKFKVLTDNVQNIEIIILKSTEQINALNTKIEEAKQVIGRGEKNIAHFTNQINGIKQAIKEREGDIEVLSNRITLIVKALDKEEHYIKILDKRITESEAAVKTIESAAKKGKIEPIAKLIDVLEGSSSIEELVNKFSAIEEKLQQKRNWAYDFQNFKNEIEQQIAILKNIVMHSQSHIIPKQGRKKNNYKVKSKYLVGLICLNVSILEYERVYTQLFSQGYSEHRYGSQLLLQSADWVAKRSTVFYYDESSKSSAKELALIMKEITGVTFVTQRGGGLGVKKGEEFITFFVHYIL